MKRSVIALLLCVTAACSSGSGGNPPSSPRAVATSTTVSSLAAALANADGHPPQASRYVAPLRRLVSRCGGSSGGEFLNNVGRIGQLIETATTAINRAKIQATRLEVLTALSAAPSQPRSPTGCQRLAAEYAAEVAGTGPAKAPSGWGGYAGSVAAWNAVHKVDHARTGSYLPRRQVEDAYQVLSSGQVTSLYEHFDPPISAKFALAQIVRDLLPGTVHPAYTLTTGQCQQAIYLGPQLGSLLHNASLGAFVELTSGGGVGHTHYDAMQVNRARITPLGAIGGEPCT